MSSARSELGTRDESSRTLVGEVGWAEVELWLWPLFNEARWGAWRQEHLGLPPCPYKADAQVSLDSHDPVSVSWARSHLACINIHFLSQIRFSTCRDRGQNRGHDF